jgi:hypothetical protein
MTTQQKLVQKKLTLLELGEYLQNVSEACRISGCSRQHFYDIKKVYESQGLEGLKEKTRRKPCVKNRVAPEIEQAVLQMALEYPAYGQLRASNELRKLAATRFGNVQEASQGFGGEGGQGGDRVH